MTTTINCVEISSNYFAFFCAMAGFLIGLLYSIIMRQKK